MEYNSILISSELKQVCPKQIIWQSLEVLESLILIIMSEYFVKHKGLLVKVHN